VNWVPEIVRVTIPALGIIVEVTTDKSHEVELVIALLESEDDVSRFDEDD
jgi:hypothetical protein